MTQELIAKGFLFSAIAGLEAAAAELFEENPKKHTEELSHQLMFEALATRTGAFYPQIRDEMARQVLDVITDWTWDNAGDQARAAFNSILEPVLTAVLDELTYDMPEVYNPECLVMRRIVDEELLHSGGPCPDDATYQAAVLGAVKTLTCPFFSKPLSVILGEKTSALGGRIREIFRQARPQRGFDPARVFGLCPMLRGKATPMLMSPWEMQRVRAKFLSPMLQLINVPTFGGPALSPALVEALVTKATGELVREDRFNFVRAGHQMFRLADPVVGVRRMPDGQNLFSVPLPTHDMPAMSCEALARRIHRRERVINASAKGWWTPGLETNDLDQLETVSGLIATVSSLAHLGSPFPWQGFATPEVTEGATYNILITDYLAGTGFTISIACDHRSIDGHKMGEFGLALAHRVQALVRGDESGQEAQPTSGAAAGCGGGSAGEADRDAAGER